MYPHQITIIEPFIPHYREDFYLQLREQISFNLIGISKPSKSDFFLESEKVKPNFVKTIKSGFNIYFLAFLTYYIQFIRGGFSTALKSSLTLLFGMIIIHMAYYLITEKNIIFYKNLKIRINK